MISAKLICVRLTPAGKRFRELGGQKSNQKLLLYAGVRLISI